MSCMLICCRCSDAGPDRQGRVPYQMPAVLLTQAFALPGVIAQADGTDLQLGRPSPFRVTRALCLLLQRAITASSTVARASWKCLKFMTPSQETWACWTQGSCEKQCSMWQHLGLYQLQSQRQLPGRHHSRAPQIRFAGVPWGWLITRGFCQQSCTVWK